MRQHPALLLVLVDASRWLGAASASAIRFAASAPDARPGPDFVAMGSGDHPHCVLVRSKDLDRLDAQLGEWMLDAASKYAEADMRYRGLTPRERQVLPLITDGLLNKQAAFALGISEATLQIHRGRIMQKMGVRTFAALVRIADILGLSGADVHIDNPRPSRSAGRRTA